MNPYIFDINTYIAADTTMQTIAGGAFKIYPLVGYQTSTPPFMLYWWMPGTMSKELYFVNVDFLKYHIVDTNAERGFKMMQALKERLNKGDLIQGQITSTNARALWCVELKSGVGAFNAALGAPGEREGFYEFQLNFEIGYVPLNQVITLGLAGEGDTP